MISGKWVLKRLGDVTSKARYVPRGFKEDVMDELVFATTTLTASERTCCWSWPSLPQRKHEGWKTSCTTCLHQNGVLRPWPARCKPSYANCSPKMLRAKKIRRSAGKNTWRAPWRKRASCQFNWTRVSGRTRRNEQQLSTRGRAADGWNSPNHQRGARRGHQRISNSWQTKSRANPSKFLVGTLTKTTAGQNGGILTTSA